MHRRGSIILGVLLTLAASQAPALSSIRSYAFVKDDASLVIRGRNIDLYGIYVPKTRGSCTGRSAETCRTRAAEALEFLISGFVECEILAQRTDRRLVGRCYADRSSFDTGTDLSAYLIERGWAMAGPDAPFEYRALEKLARERDAGFWGHGRVRTLRGFR